MYQVEECYYKLKEMFFPSKPKWEKLTFTKEAWMKLMCYINLIGDYEITGFGRVVNNEIVDIKILEQEVKTSTVDCDLVAMQKFLMSIPKDQMGEWILDWHSHVNMGVFASGTDTTNYAQQYKARCNNQYPLLIVNKRQEYYARCYISEGKQTELKIDIKAEEITEDKLKEIYATCKKDIEELCTKVTYTVKNKDEKTTQRSFFPYQTYTNNGYDSSDYEARYGWSNKVDLSKYKKKGLVTLVKGKEKNSCEKQENNSNEDDELCVSCGIPLYEEEQLMRGICDDCWEMMTPSDRAQWILNLE